METNHRVANYSSSSRNKTIVAQAMKEEFMFLELGVAAKGFRNSVDQEHTSVLEHLAATLRPNKWTDEKHGLFLKSMEASFVNQLHDSIDVLGFSSQENHFDPSTQKHMSNLNSSGQFKVFREGWKGKINFKRDEVEMKKQDESSSGVDEISSNPWIRRYKPECRNQSRTQAQVEFPASAFYVRHRPRASNTSCAAQSLEVTDQNFVDEDTNKDDRECEIQSSKRIKTEPFTNQDY